MYHVKELALISKVLMTKFGDKKDILLSERSLQVTDAGYNEK